MNAHTTISAVLSGTPVPPIALLRALPPGPLAKEHQRLKRLAELFAAFDRDDMEAGVELLLAELDAHAGDPDLEPEEDRCTAQDDDLSDIRIERMGYGSDHPREDDGCESSGWSEWHTRGRRKLTSADTEERGVCGTLGSPRHEDEEDDDAREAAGDELDGNASEDDWMKHDGGAGPGCPLADGLEPTLGAPEAYSGRWGGNLIMRNNEDGECEPRHQPPTMGGPLAANDQVPA